MFTKMRKLFFFRFVMSRFFRCCILVDIVYQLRYLARAFCMHGLGVSRTCSRSVFSIRSHMNKTYTHIQLVQISNTSESGTTQICKQSTSFVFNVIIRNTIMLGFVSYDYVISSPPLYYFYVRHIFSHLHTHSYHHNVVYLRIF